MEHVTLEDAVARHVRPGDTVQVLCGHSRWTAAAREMARQHWGADAGFTLVMLSLSSLGALFFRGQMVRKVVTTYSGDTFPTYTPNPIFQEAYASGAVDGRALVDPHLHPAPRGRGARAAGHRDGLARRARRWRRTTPFTVADTAVRAGRAAGAARARRHPRPRRGRRPGGQRGAVRAPPRRGVGGVGGAARAWWPRSSAWWSASTGSGHRVEDPRPPRAGGGRGALRRPSRRAVRAAGSRCRPTARTSAFWTEARAATRAGLRRLGPALGARARHPRRLSRATGARAPRLAVGAHRPRVVARRTPRPIPSTPSAPPSRWEHAAAYGARELEVVAAAHDADAVLAGAGVANLAAWVAVARARAGGSALELTAELGLWGYTPTPADPYIFNHRVFPGSPMLADASTVLGMVVGGPGTRTIACLGAAQVDRDGNLNSTLIPGGPFLVGSGGANDVASRAAACVVVALARPDRLVERVGFVTSPGRPRDERRHRPRRAAPARRHAAGRGGRRAGPGRWPSGCGRSVDACGWDVAVATSVSELDAGDDRRGAGPAPLRPRAPVPVLPGLADRVG